MIALKLELFGDDQRQRMRLALLPLRALTKDLAGALHDHLYCGPPMPWVAAVVGLDDRYGLERRFLRGRKDYLQANSIGSRGIYLWYTLEPGLYEINEQVSWRGWDRRFEVVDQSGSRRRLTREEALAWARDHSASTS